MPGIQFNKNDTVLFIYDELTRQICDYNANDADTKGRLGKVVHFEPRIMIVALAHFPDKGKTLTVPSDRYEHIKVVENAVTI